MGGLRRPMPVTYDDDDGRAGLGAGVVAARRLLLQGGRAVRRGPRGAAATSPACPRGSAGSCWSPRSPRSRSPRRTRPPAADDLRRPVPRRRAARTRRRPLMRWPLVVLAVPAAALGVVGLSAGWLPTWLRPGRRRAALASRRSSRRCVSLALVVLGAGVVWTSLARRSGRRPGALAARAGVRRGCATRLRRRRRRTTGSLVRPLRALARAVVVAVDDDRRRAAVQGTGAATARAALRPAPAPERQPAGVPHRCAGRRQRPARRRRRGGVGMTALSWVVVALLVAAGRGQRSRCCSPGSRADALGGPVRRRRHRRRAGRSPWSLAGGFDRGARRAAAGRRRRRLGAAARPAVPPRASTASRCRWSC